MLIIHNKSHSDGGVEKRRITTHSISNYLIIQHYNEVHKKYWRNNRKMDVL